MVISFLFRCKRVRKTKMHCLCPFISKLVKMNRQRQFSDRKTFVLSDLPENRTAFSTIFTKPSVSLCFRAVHFIKRPRRIGKSNGKDRYSSKTGHYSYKKLDEVVITNPQTRHYSFDIPVNLSNIEHREIVQGLSP